ncbi:MAG: hypothetical protein QNJ51_24390 [Calothrix sp. MO_167.B12]|nr:hypothetical protein [Calothrix sp. MO_167.B12]
MAPNWWAPQAPTTSVEECVSPSPRLRVSASPRLRVSASLLDGCVGVDCPDSFIFAITSAQRQLSLVNPSTDIITEKESLY